MALRGRQQYRAKYSFGKRSCQHAKTLAAREQHEIPAPKHRRHQGDALGLRRRDARNGLPHCKATIVRELGVTQDGCEATATGDDPDGFFTAADGRKLPRGAHHPSDHRMESFVHGDDQELWSGIDEGRCPAARPG